MPTLGNPKPRFLKFVAKPANVGNVELSKAEPVYIDGLPVDAANTSVEADATSDLAAAADIQELAEALSARIKALEDAAATP